MVLALTDIIDAKCKPIQGAIDVQTTELENLHKVVAKLERKIEQMEKHTSALEQQMVVDATKLCHTNSPQYDRASDPSVLKVNSIWAVGKQDMEEALRRHIDGHVSDSHWKVEEASGSDVGKHW
eukprot:11674076-Karenia_brevis.AAC.1